MSLFRFQWLRSFIRRHTKPVPYERATVWKQRLSIGYAIIAWNAFGFVLYMIFTGKADWAQYHGLKTSEEAKLTPAQQWSKTLGIKEATVYRVSGFNVSKYKIHNKFDETEQKATTTDKLDETNKAQKST